MSTSPQPTIQPKDWHVYLLTNPHTSNTYLGVTNNPKRRLRQHNGEISGGAKATHSFGKDWTIHALISNLTKSQALSMERTCKNKRRRAKGKTPLERRLYTINSVLPKFPDAKFLNTDKPDAQKSYNAQNANN